MARITVTDFLNLWNKAHQKGVGLSELQEDIKEAINEQERQEYVDKLPHTD